MADQSVWKENLKYHRLVVYIVVLIFIWATYNFSSGNWSYDNGQPKISGQKVNGKDEGTWTWFYENGKKRMEGNFNNGKRNGIWTIWDSTGVKLSKTTYQNDKLNGKFTRWYSNGKIESEGTYHNDTIHTVTYYHTDGSRK